MRFLHKFEAFLEGLSNEQLQNLSEVAEQMMQTRSESSSDSTEEGTHSGNGNVAEDFKVTRTEKINDNRKTPVKFKKNKWEDTGEFSDVETPNFEKTPVRDLSRTRSVWSAMFVEENSLLMKILSMVNFIGVIVAQEDNQ